MAAAEDAPRKSTAILFEPAFRTHRLDESRRKPFDWCSAYVDVAAQCFARLGAPRQMSRAADHDLIATGSKRDDAARFCFELFHRISRSASRRVIARFFSDIRTDFNLPFLTSERIVSILILRKAAASVRPTSSSSQRSRSGSRAMLFLRRLEVASLALDPFDDIRELFHRHL